jgi:hypothetical protein
VKWLQRTLLPLALLVLPGATVLSATGPYGVNWNDGYFSGGAYAGTDYAFVPWGTSSYTDVDGLGPGGANLAAFEAEYQARLYDPVSTVDQGRAAAEIDMMLGVSGPNFGGSIQAGIDYAQANFTNWENLIALYNSGTVPGYSVQWNVPFNFASISGDWTAVGATGTNDPSDIADCTHGQNCVGDLILVTPDPDHGVEQVVEFNANGQLLLIRGGCGCMSGTTQSLAMPGSTITLTKTSSVPSLPVGGTMAYSITAAESPQTPLNDATITDQIPVQFTPIAGSCSPGPCTIAGNTVTWSFATPADATVLNNIATSSETLTVGVTAITPGNNIVNTATGAATDYLGNNVTVNPGSAQTSIVSAAVTPSFIGQNSDIHAGGSLCDEPAGPSAGYVQGAPSATSTSQYVVSASTTITDFGSNGSASGTPGDNLDFGTGGFYSQICRPDLLNAAINGRTGVQQGTIAATPGPFTAVDVGCLTTPAANCGPGLTGGLDTYYFDGNDLHLSGVVNQKITIVATTGSVDITGPVTLTAAVMPANAAASLGLIAAGDIDIDSSVTQVDAYLFSDGTIDTCVEADGTCDSTLTVDGFLMAHQLLLHRLGPAAAPGSSVGEDIVTTPQIYLNAPAFFNTSIDGQPLEGQGERPPLF